MIEAARISAPLAARLSARLSSPMAFGTCLLFAPQMQVSIFSAQDAHNPGNGLHTVQISNAYSDIGGRVQVQNNGHASACGVPHADVTGSKAFRPNLLGEKGGGGLHAVCCIESVSV